MIPAESTVHRRRPRHTGRIALSEPHFEALLAGADLPGLEAFIGPRSAWMADAACRETPAVSFFPGLGESTEDAKAVCGRCLVADERLAYARQNGEEAGVWGGQTFAPPRGTGTPRGPRTPPAVAKAPRPCRPGEARQAGDAAARAKLDKLATQAAGWRRKALAARAARRARVL